MGASELPFLADVSITITDDHSYVGESTIVGDYCVVEYAARIYDGVLIKDGSTISGFVCNNCSIGENSIIQGDLIHKFKSVNYSVNSFFRGHGYCGARKGPT